MEDWIDIGSADELSATQLKRVTAMNREFSFLQRYKVWRPLKHVQSRSADHWAMASSMANTLFAHGRNVDIVRNSTELAEGAAILAKRCLELVAQLIARDDAPTSIERGGRKAHPMHVYGDAQGRAVRDASVSSKAELVTMSPTSNQCPLYPQKRT
jgi:hypothetical protein